MQKSFRWIVKDGIPILYVSLMIYTAISKLRTYTETREQLSLMPLMDGFSDLVSWLLPVTEIIIGILIFIPITRRKGLYLGTGLMILFTAYVVYLLMYHPHLPCTCGGFLQAFTWPQHLVFNGVFIVLGILALALDRRGSPFNKDLDYHLG